MQSVDITPMLLDSEPDTWIIAPEVKVKGQEDVNRCTSSLAICKAM